MIDPVKLQKALAVSPDGVLGPVTYTALFQKCGAPIPIAEELGLAAAVLFAPFGLIADRLRIAHFLAQLIHESGSFRYMEEIASGKAYEGRKDLGNVHPGDGVRYKGRGPIQLTGRTNYRVYGRKIGIDLERHPHLAAIPSIGLRTALEFWGMNGLNPLAERDDIETITRRINGGLNGLVERKKALFRINRWLP